MDGMDGIEEIDGIDPGQGEKATRRQGEVEEIEEIDPGQGDKETRRQGEIEEIDEIYEESKEKYDLQSKGYTLAQNNPNPFANSTQVTYTLPESGNVSITVKNMLGRQVLKVNRIEQNAGKYSITMDFSKYPDGIYFISLVVDGKITCKIKAVKTK